MKKFWKATLIPGLCCIFAGLVIGAVLITGFSDELIKYREEFSINEDNFWKYFGAEKIYGVTYKSYELGDMEEAYYVEISKDEQITGIDFSFAVGEVKIKTGETMEVVVEDTFQDAIRSEVRDGSWYIEDRLAESGKLPVNYTPKITITIPSGTLFDDIDIYLAAGALEAEELLAEEMKLEVDAGSMKVYELEAAKSLVVKNGAGEIKVYDAVARNLEVNNGVGAVSITGAVSGHSTVECGIGEVEIFLTDRERVNFNYSVDCGIGKVEIDNKKFTGNAESFSTDHTEADYFELKCGIGHIEIDVNDN